MDVDTAQRLLQGFGVEEPLTALDPLGHGLIHQTFRCRAGDQDYVLQRVNTDVFKDPASLAQAARRVQHHLWTAHREGRYRLQLPRTLPVVEDRADADLPDLQRHADGSLWRAMHHVRDSRALKVTDSPEQAALAADAYGHFAAVLADLAPEEVPVSLPGFHDPQRRLAELERAVEGDTHDRRGSCAAEIEYCVEQRQEAKAFLPSLKGRELRVCHNDTKLDNLLFDQAGQQVLAVIDLDTTMPGHWAYDFGDLVRSVAADDSQQIRDDYLEALADGYLTALGPLADSTTRRTLWAGVRLMPLMLGLRFLADHLLGDGYFPAQYPGHNLERARRQLAMHRDLVCREKTLRPRVVGCKMG